MRFRLLPNVHRLVVSLLGKTHNLYSVKKHRPSKFLLQSLGENNNEHKQVTTGKNKKQMSDIRYFINV